MEGFVHLNVHTGYSLLEGACRLRELCEKAKALEMPALAITDTGALYGAIEFSDICAELGIKAIIGCEVRVSENNRYMKTSGEPSRLTLLCKNETGYKNLCRLISKQVEILGEFVTDKDCIEEYSEGLIALSGGKNGEITRLIKSKRNSEAEKCALWYKSIFKEDFYLELNNHSDIDDVRVCKELRALSEKTGIKTCPTNNVHYVEKSQSRVQKLLECIKENKILSENSTSGLRGDEYYLKSREEMARFFTEEELSVPETVAEQCNFRFEFGVTKLPLFKKEGISDNAEYFRKLCAKGAEKRYGTVTEEIKNRLDYELSVIEKMGFVDYFLIVWDFVRYAKTNDIPVGPGRGSGAGSLCAYCMGITEIDPLRFNLLFERFLNPERVSMPDFDIDFCNERRGEVIEYVRNRYGAQCVAQIAAFDTLKAKAAIRDAGRALGISQRKTDAAAKAVPFSINPDLSEELKSGELKELYNSDGDIRHLIDAALMIEGFPRHTTVHAAGVVITREPVMEYAPIEVNADGAKTQFTMTALERLGLLKMDFLGLRNLTVIHKTCMKIRETQPDFDISKISDGDEKTYAMLGQGKTSGVFQLESDGMSSVIARLKPQSIEDLTAAIALYRPGPMDSIPAYIENRHKDPAEITYKHPLLKNILSVTYGCMVYQEQVMQICREIGGYSYGRADLVRRAMSKKKRGVMEKEHDAFVYGTETNCGAIKNGVDEKTANDIFDEMEKFSSYAFNKSHAAAYATVAYQTAYLRCHYYKEYMSALCSSVMDYTGKLAEYAADITSNGVALLPPDINKSYADFVVEDNAVRFGLAAVKNLGRSFVEEMTKERDENGSFASPEDLALRTARFGNNRRYTEALIKCGALDDLGVSRSGLLSGIDGLLSYAARESFRQESGQLDLLGESDEKTGYVFPKSEEFPKTKLLGLEFESIGFYVSGHPAGIYLPRAENCLFIADALDLSDNAPCSVMALVSDVRNHYAKSGEMAFAELEDESGTISAVIFPSVFSDAERLSVGKVYYLNGRINKKDRKTSFVINTIKRVETLPEASSKTLFINFENDLDPRIAKITELLFKFRGTCAVRACFRDKREVRRINGLRGARLCPELLNKLRGILGNDNVIVK
ncbi:MAG: DNA polymerase III subunit alpha [Oscillospiraceae bacterium]|nr:DNA polymerase III subunit alpha [Oscillospiraceae bacterium]